MRTRNPAALGNGPMIGRPSASRRGIFECLENRRLLSGGMPDPSFGSGGKVLTAFLGSRSDAPADVAVQADGKFIVGGTSTDRVESDFALARYNPDGTLDTTFGDKGRVRTDIRLDDVINDITLQSDGKILAAGFSSNVAANGALEYAFALVRYNVNGSLDAGFGNNGVVTTRIEGYDFAQRVLVLADGKIIVGGSTQSPGPTPADFALARYTPAGALDPTFGTGGIVVSDIAGAADAPRDFLAMGNKILAVGDTSIGAASSSVLLARYDASGKLDPTFGVGGKTIISANGEHIASAALLASGNIIVAGNDAAAFTLRRFTASGQPDAAFGVAGLVRKDLTPSDQANRLIVLSGDKLLLGATVSNSGNPSTDSDRALLRFNANGSIDATFGQNGVALDARAGAQTLAGFAVRSDGSILAAGSDATANPDFNVVRYQATGAIDTTFGRGGLVTTDFLSAVASRALDVAMQSDGKIVAVGTAQAGPLGNGQNIAIARYLPSGVLDPTFGVGGQVQAGLGEPTRVFVRSDGRIVIAFIGTDQRTRFMQFNANGKLDTTFGVNGVADPNLFAQRGGANIARMADGRLLIAGVSANVGPSALAVARMTPDGKFDPTFGVNGVTTADLGDFSPYSIAITPDSRIIVGGANYPSRSQPFTTQLALVRFHFSGILDPSFGNGGEVIVTNGPTSNAAVAIAVQEDGAIVAASGENNDMRLTRFNRRGEIDTTFFGVNGTTPLPFPVTRLIIDRWGSTVVAGASGPDTLSLTTYQNGQVNPFFGTNGVANITVPPFATPGGLVLDGSNRYLIAGGAGGQFALARFNSVFTTPFGDQPIAIPGGIIEAENFDRGVNGADLHSHGNGLDGVSYHDASPGNAGNVYRIDADVDLDVSKDTGGGYMVRSTQAGEWLDYGINVTESGVYDLEARVASLGAGGTFSISVDDQEVSGPITVPDTGGFQNWRTITKSGVPLSVGFHFLRLNMLTIGRSGVTGNFNWLRLVPAAGKRGLVATYYDTQDLTGPAISAFVSDVNFNWGIGSPLPAIAPDTFSARFDGFLQAPATGNYTIYTRADDGVRLWIDGQLLINDWTRHPATDRSAIFHLEAGKKYSLRLEYFEAYGSASLQLSWSSLTMPRQVIPTSAFSTV
ncbi:MAG: uncharacterized protein JWN40_3648 [Phycisphaerales bacterium]|nr:uncharacterized protein [Phycisphaerales bacterium]